MQVFLGKVDTRLKVDADLDQLLAKGPQATRQGAVELVDGGAVTRLCPGVDQVDDRLGLSEVKTPVKECPPGELPRFRHSHALRQDRVKDTLGDQNAPVTTDFNYIFARVGARLPHDAEQSFVDPLVLAIDYETVISVMRLQSRDGQPVGPYEHPLSHCYRVRPADPHQADSADAQRRGDSGYRISRRRFHGTSGSAPAA